MSYLDDIVQALSVLRKGGLILFPSDTVWAIGCDATNEAAVERLYELKSHRSPENLVVLIHDEQDLPRYTEQPFLHSFDYIKGVHKPTTVVYESPRGLATNIIDTDGTVAIRVVNSEFAGELIQQFGGPLLSATANRYEAPFPAMFSQIEETVRAGVDYVVRFRQDETNRREPSSIIRWHRDGSISILRP